MICVADSFDAMNSNRVYRKKLTKDYIIKEIGDILENVIVEAVRSRQYDNMSCRAEARERISRYVMKETGKRPMILPAIVEINIGV